MQKRIVSLFLVFMIGCAGCRPGAADKKRPSEPAPLTVAVSVEPHAFLIDQIGGGKVRVEVLVPQGKEPETYQITPEKLAALSRIKVYFRTGMPFEEKLIPKLQSVSKHVRVIDLRDGIELRTLEIHRHSADADHDHRHHHETDPHIWFAPSLLQREAGAVLNVLQECQPSEADFFRKNYETLQAKIDGLQREIAELLKPVRERQVFVLHPAYGYFCDEFQLVQRAVEFEGKSPKPQQIAELIEIIKKLERPPVIFVQPEFHPSSAKALAEAVKAELVIHSPLDRDILKSMKQFAEKLAK
ncbi:MAG: zinc ABC transporter substrate-binding protein [Planctomycetaceae bacterium]|jgi:zinc transport system substrate-binding protein|nr:zinc ABC transporter substrate-binding protein [Planctomycetaceae bacterium]